METFSDQCTTSPCVNSTNQALVDSIICQTFTITRGSIKLELSDGYFLDCSDFKIPKGRGVEIVTQKNDILLNHKAGKDLKDYLVNLPYPPFPPPKDSVIKEIIIKGNFNIFKRLTSLFSPSLPRISPMTLQNPPF